MSHFAVLARDGHARRGRLLTAHGPVDTPAFMPVGTHATVKATAPPTLTAVGSQMILANAYHLLLRPGAERVEAFGGLGRFMNWDGATLTDSGGFQTWSLAKLCDIDESGIRFRSHLDGRLEHLTPERSMATQRQIGSDVVMCLDECPGYPISHDEAQIRMRRSLRWAERCRGSFVADGRQLLFGIVQGGVYPDLRLESARQLHDIGFDGYAIGGLAVGEGQELLFESLDQVVPALDQERPRYLMGVGRPTDIIGAVRRGIDLFDCVLPTRAGRTGRAYTRSGVVNIRNSPHRNDVSPLDDGCRCATCQGYSRGYLHHLFAANEILGIMLLTAHNIYTYQALMSQLQTAIENHTLDRFAFSPDPN